MKTGTLCECGHPKHSHKGLGVKVEDTEPTRVHVCLPVTREVCDCREFKARKGTQ